MKLMLVVAGLAAVLSIGITSVSSAGNYGHDTRCTTHVHAGLPYDQWTDVHMVLSGAGDNFWITEPAAWAGHYLIQSFRFIDQSPDIVPGETDAGWSPWYAKGQKTGPSAHSSTIECKGPFADANPPYWVDSVDILLPADK